MLTRNVESMENLAAERRVRPRVAAGPAVRTAFLVVGLLVMVGGILAARGYWSSDDSGGSARVGAMPVSPEIEATFGVRFVGVDITAAGGMIQIRYQIIDSDKTAGIHDNEGAPHIIAADGHEFADPGIAGHSHVGGTKASGTSDYVLLANARGAVKPGDVVTIKIGELELHNVPVD